MKLRFTRWSIIPAVALALFAACSDQGTPAEQLLGPDQASFGKGKETAPGQKKKAKVRVRGKNGKETTYVLLNGEGGLTASRTVYPGRRVTDVVDVAIPGIGGIRVPVTAINKPTTFTISTVSRVAADGAEYLAIDLHALTNDAQRTDVGKNGFANDVTLYLTKPAQIAAVSGATILWEKSTNLFHDVQCRSLEGAESEGSECVTDADGTLEARLKHFSAYVIAIDE